MSEYTVKQGDLGPEIEVSHALMPNTTGWSCNLLVLNAAGASQLARAVTTTNVSQSAFLVQLTVAETSLLAIDSYRLTIELANSGLTPPFNEEYHHILNVDPEMEALDEPALIAVTKGTNSFMTYEEALLAIARAPQLPALASAGRMQLRAALVSAYNNIGRLNVDFGVLDVDGNEVYCSLDFSEADIVALEAKAYNALIIAQLTEANGILGGNPVEDRRRMGLLSDSAGESAHFFRTSKPLELPVYRDTMNALRGYVFWTGKVSR